MIILSYLAMIAGMMGTIGGILMLAQDAPGASLPATLFWLTIAIGAFIWGRRLERKQKQANASAKTTKSTR